MLRLTISLFLTSIIFISCSNPEIEQKPKDLLPKDKMIALMADLQLVEAAKVMHYLNPQHESLEKRDFQLKVYDDHQVQDTLFIQSLNYYATQKEDMMEIYEGVIDALQIRQEELR